MSRKYVTSDDFGKVMVDLLNDYYDDVFGDVKETTDDLGRQALSMVRSKSPKNTGAYAAGWGKNTQNNKNAGYYAVRIRNKDHYRLTHLLNFGHHWKSYGKVWTRKHKGDNHITETELEFKRKFATELRTKLER